MPGRLCIFDDTAFKQDIIQQFGMFENRVGDIEKHYNVAPTSNLPIYTNSKTYTYAHFGLIPSWANSRSSMQVNARSETIYEKSSFKEAYKHRRCLIPLNGYYEWKKDSENKTSQPYFITSADRVYFVFAGIYESWYDNELGKSIVTCALLTTEPNEKIGTLHDRMPVILELHQWKTWLAEGSNYSDLNKLFTPISSEAIKYHQVSSEVNSVNNNTAACIKASKKSKLNQGTLF